MLQIGLGTSASPVPHSDQPSLFLDDDGYYWFLHPLFKELADQTGEYIDLYGHSWFAGDNRSALEQMLHQAVALVEAQPESWAVIVGHSGARGEVYMGVQKIRYQETLGQWLSLCEQARQHDLAVVCFGD
jgi:hypothetical protein